MARSKTRSAAAANGSNNNAKEENKPSKTAASTASSSSNKKSSKTTTCALGQDGCKKPDGKISWVCCDGCEAWYHCNCVGVNPKEAAEIIFHCKACKPVKEEEFHNNRDSIKSELENLMKTHSLFSTSVIARKCFATKAKSDAYHAANGGKGAPATLRELADKVDRDIATLDHFKKYTEDMVEKMKANLKSDHQDDIEKIAKALEKIITEASKKKATMVANKKTAKASSTTTNEVKKETPAKRGKAAKKAEEDGKAEAEPEAKRKKEDVSKKSAAPIVKAEDKEPETTTKRGGRKAAAAAVAAQPKKSQEPKAPKKEEEKKKVEPEQPAPAVEAPKMVAVASKCEMCTKATAPPVYQCVDFHVICHDCLNAAERGYCPICRKTGKNRRPKRHDKLTTLKSKTEESAVEKMDVEEPKVKDEPLKMEAKQQKAADLQPESRQQPPAAEEAGKKSRKRRGGKMAAEDEEEAAKAKKVASPPKQRKPTKAQEAKMKAAAEAAAKSKPMANAQPPKLETLFSPGSPTSATILPKSVLLPTSPIVQNLLPKPQPPQVAAVQAFQLRPTTGSLQITGIPTMSGGGPVPTGQPQFRMAANAAHPNRPQGLQFFKIVEGKPVQIGAPSGAGGDASIQPRLPTSPLPIQPNMTGGGTGPKLLYVRNPVPATSAAAGLTTTSAGPISPTRPQLGPKQIILLSNKGPGKSAILTPVSPTSNPAAGIVKLVSTAGGNSGDAGKLILGSNVARVAPQLQGPVLLRPLGTLPSPPLPPPQLPNVPLPRAALSTSTATSAADKAQALLPKSPLPPAQIKNAPMMKLTAGPPPTTVPTSAPTSSSATTGTTSTSGSGTPSATGKSDSVVNKAFIWKNSDKTQFKLSARFNFDLFREYQKAHPNKDIRFALASIITEDKSNEFSFYLSQQKENNETFWQLGVRAKNVSEHVWHLKVKVDPPVFLVNNGSFRQTIANFKIPKDVSDKAVVDYELLLMGKASAVATAAAAAAGGVPPVTTKGRGKKSAAQQQQQQQQQQQPAQ